MSQLTEWVLAHDPLTIAAAPNDGGYDALSTTTQRQWLPVIGPSAMVMLQHFARALWLGPPRELELTWLAGRLGLGRNVGRNTPVVRTVCRLARFGFVYPAGDVLMVRLWLPSPTPAGCDRDIGPLVAGTVGPS